MGIDAQKFKAIYFNFLHCRERAFKLSPIHAQTKSPKYREISDVPDKVIQVINGKIQILYIIYKKYSLPEKNVYYYYKNRYSILKNLKLSDFTTILIIFISVVSKKITVVTHYPMQIFLIKSLTRVILDLAKPFLHFYSQILSSVFLRNRIFTIKKLILAQYNVGLLHFFFLL